MPILDNAVMLLPLCLLHIITGTSKSAYTSVGNQRKHKWRKPQYMKLRKACTSKNNPVLLAWYHIVPVLISSYLCCTSSAFSNTSSSTNTIKTMNNSKYHTFRRKYNITPIRKIINYNNKLLQLSRRNHRHPTCLTTDHKYKNNNKKPCPMIFDSDSIPIRVDNCCSRTLSGSLHDFDKTTLTSAATNMIITGFGDTETRITHTGTIIWNIHDDHG
jgi:hypothetical protein